MAPSARSPKRNHRATRPVDPDRAFELLHAQSELLDFVAEARDGRHALTRLAAIVERTFAGASCLVWTAEQPGVGPATIGTTTPSAEFLDCITRGVDQGPLTRSASPGADRATIFADLGPVTINPALGELASRFGVRALWTFPILRGSAERLGLLLIMFAEPREPTADDAWLADRLVQLARFAIHNSRRTAALQSADQRFTSLAASIPGVVYQRVVRPDGEIRYTYISDGARDLFGVSPDEILADPNALFDCHGPEYRETFRDRLLQASRDLTLWDVEATIISRSGQRKFTHAIAKPHRQSDGTVVWDGVILDATRIKEAELAASAAASRTREAIIESLSQGFVLLDSKDSLVVCNSHYRSLYPDVATLSTEQPSYEDLIRAEYGAAPTGDSVDALNRRLAQHAQPHQTIERQLPSGRWVLINEHRVAGGGSVILHTDVTPLKEREAALARSNRELQDFASVASHDLQEPLRKIEAFSDQLRRRSSGSLDDNGRFYLERIEKASRRMRALIDDLLSYSRVSTKAQPFARCDLNKIIEGVLSDLRIRIVETQGTIEVGQLPTIDADPIQMRQLFQNLISNALKFHRKDKPPVVRVTAEPATAGKSADSCVLHVIDNGIGFDPKYTDRIFSIFQRLHSRSEYEGTGIGLATCRKIVERHKGTITADSAPDQGSDFRIVLPVRQQNLDFKP